MKCKRCNVTFSGNLINCPLCNTKLDGKRLESVFPKVNNKNPLLKKIMLFVSFCILTLFAFFEYTFTNSVEIIKYIAFALLTNYILVNFIVSNYKDALKMLNKYFWIILTLLFMWYLITRSLIITTYFIPILCIVIFAFNSILIIIKSDYIVRYIKTILLDCLVGIIPLLLNLFKLTTLPILSNIVFVIDLLVFVGMVTFFHNQIIDELKKNLSI